MQHYDLNTAIKTSTIAAGVAAYVAEFGDEVTLEMI